MFTRSIGPRAGPIPDVEKEEKRGHNDKETSLQDNIFPRLLQDVVGTFADAADI